MTAPAKAYLRSLPRRAHTSHRGGSKLWPENTLLAFSNAVRLYQTDVLELDVQPSQDGAVMVFHDDQLERTTNGRGPIASKTRAQLQALDAGWQWPQFRGTGVHIPTLQDVLAAFPQHHINIELKVGDDAFLDRFSCVIEQNAAQDRVCIGHVDEERAHALRARLPACAFWYPETAIMGLVMAAKSGEAAPDVPWDVVSAPMEYGGFPVVDAALTRLAHEQGKVVHVWTVDEAEHMQAMWNAGVDSILTDRPDVLRAVMDLQDT